VDVRRKAQLLLNEEKARSLISDPLRDVIKVLPACGL
jgi:hypothetical protein